MKTIYSFLVLYFVNLCIFAQASANDSVILDPGYAKAVFYSMQNGTLTNPAIKNSDIQIRFENRSASIRTVDGWGAQTYLTLLNDTTQWATLDTTGMTAVYNSDTAWENGSFNTTSTGHPSYGWGAYNNINHNIYGTKLFVVKTQLGSYKKVWVKVLNTVAKTYTIRFANLDGSMDTTVDIGRADYPGQNFGYYCFDTYTKQAAEPIGAAWDLVFRKYLRTSDYYPVTGVMTNLNTKSAEARAVADPYTTSGSGLTYINDITNIGSDWKNFIMPGGPWVIEDSLAYFLLTQENKIWRIVFTGFGGGTTGVINFNKALLYDPTSIAATSNNSTASAIYPNPGKPNSVIVYNALQAKKLDIHIFDINGKMAYHNTFDASEGINQFPIGQLDLLNGMYFVQMTDGSGITSLKYIVAN